MVCLRVAVAAVLSVGMSAADSDIATPMLRGAASARPPATPAVSESTEFGDDAENLWRAGHTSIRRGPFGGVHVGHTGVRVNRRGVHVGHTGATFRPWLLEEVNSSDVSDADASEVASRVDEFWGHIGHTGASWGGWRGGGHIGHTGATWGRHWMLDEVNTTDNSTDSVASASDDVPQAGASTSDDETDEGFWVHVGHTGANWGRFGRGGHIGHTGATWGHHWMLSEVNGSEANATIDGGEAMDGFWVHVGHTGATWGRWGRRGHIGHTGATWGHPWMLDAINGTAAGDEINGTAGDEGVPGPDDEFWVHVGHTGARMGRGGVHVGHTGATWGRPWVLDEENISIVNSDEDSGSESGASGDSNVAPAEFWVHVGHTGATVGMGGVHVDHVGSAWGHRGAYR